MTVRTLVATNFTGGEVSPSTFSRSDLDNYYNLASSIENMAVTGAGTVEKRAGSNFVPNDATQEINAVIGQYPNSVTCSQGLETWAFDADQQYVIANSSLELPQFDKGLASGSVVDLPNNAIPEASDVAANDYKFHNYSMVYRDGAHVNGWYYAPRYDGILTYERTFTDGDTVVVAGSGNNIRTLSDGDISIDGLVAAFAGQDFYGNQPNLTHDLTASGNLAIQSWPYPSNPQVIIRKGDDTVAGAFKPAAANFVDGPYIFANGDVSDVKKCYVVNLEETTNGPENKPDGCPTRDIRIGDGEFLEWTEQEGIFPASPDGSFLTAEELKESFLKGGGLAEIRWEFATDPNHPNNTNPPLQNVKIGSPFAVAYKSENEDGVAVTARASGYIVANPSYSVTNDEGVVEFKRTNSAIVRWTIPPKDIDGQSSQRNFSSSEWFIGANVNSGVSASTFFQGRWFFSLIDHPNRIFATRVNGWGKQEFPNEYLGSSLCADFPTNGFEEIDCGFSDRRDAAVIVDTDGLDIALDAGLSEPVETFVADERGLLAFTRSNVFLIQGGGGAGLAITPTSFSVNRQSRIGCVDRVSAQSLQDVTLFSGPDGKGVYAVSYNNNREKYTTNEVSITAQHLFQRAGGTVVEMTSENVPKPKITMIQRDGGVVTFYYNPNTRVNAFTRETFALQDNTATRIKSLTTAYETRTNFQYRLLSKNIDSPITQFFITRASVLDDYDNQITQSDFSAKTVTEPTHFLDFADRTELQPGVLPSSVTLEPEFFKFLTGIAACVYDQSTRTYQVATGLSADADGVVTLPSTLTAPVGKGRLFVGFPYTAKVVTAPIQNLTGAVRRGAADHSIQKRIVKAFLRLVNSSGGKCGQDSTSALLYRRPSDSMSKLTPEFTGVIEHSVAGSSSDSPTLTIEHEEPLRFEVGSVAMQIDAGGVS